jgi:serine/threonine protein phosphatase PrpC
MQGWRKRMEDAHLTDLDKGPNQNTQIFAVFDGHGGSEVAKFVENHFTEELLKNENYLKNDIKKALEDNFLKMDTLMLEKEGSEELLKEYQKSKEEASKMKENNKNAQIEMLRQVIDPKEQPNAKISMFTGCTANVLIIQDNKLYFANAGDSRSVICKKGQAFAMSTDHKPSIPAELKRIEKAGGWVSDGRVLGNLNLSRGLGDSEYKMDKKLKPADQILSNFPETKIENFTKDIDFIVLACDGIWDCKSNQEVCEFFLDKFTKEPNGKLSKYIEDLYDEILAPDVFTDTGVGCDNMSCIIIQFKKK